jgi:hypothetical protein
MSSPLQQTTNVDVDAVPETTTAESRAPEGAAGSPLPAVGTNAVSEWTMWDPNLWWTDWSLPPDPRPSWEQWFDWVNQLQALTPALGDASRDWQTMVGQFDDSLQSVRTMRADLAGWTGPSAQTMSESLDRLEDSITTKSAAIRENPAKLQELAQAISDAVPPMTALDAEYQQVLQDLNACRQVAERGKPIMLNLATKLLQTGTDLENSVRTDNLAPQPVPPQAVTLTDGPQGPSQQLTQVAGSVNTTGPGTVTPAAQIAVADQPSVTGSTGSTGLGQVTTAQPVAATSLPGVSVGPAASTPTAAPSGTLSDTQAASPTLAGVSTGGAAPTLAAPTVPPATMAAAPMAASGPAVSVPILNPSVAPTVTTGAVPVPMVNPLVAPTVTTGAVPVPMVNPLVAPAEDRKEDKKAPVAVPVPVVGVPVSGSAAVPTALRGRTGEQTPPVPVFTGTVRRARPRTPGREDEAFTVEDAGTGTVTAPK